MQQGLTISGDECINMLGNRILIQRDGPEVRIGSIIIPDESQERPVSGLVKSVGPQVVEVRVGDRVHYSARGRKDLNINGIYHQIITEADVFGVEES